MSGPPLKLIHGVEVLTSRRFAATWRFWSEQTSEAIVASLKPGRSDALKVKPDGRVFDGNTRIKVLMDRGYNVDDLPREPV